MPFLIVVLNIAKLHIFFVFFGKNDEKLSNKRVPDFAKASERYDFQMFKHDFYAEQNKNHAAGDFGLGFVP